MKKQKGISIYGMQILFALIPLVVGAIILTIFSVVNITSHMEESMYSRLKAVATGTRMYFEYDVENGIISQDDESFEYCDNMKAQGVDVTVFEGDTRFITSLRNADGSRNIGTQANADIWATVKAGGEYHSGGVMIGGKEYYVYYLPLYDGSGKVWGMSFAGEPASAVHASKNAVMLSSILVALITVAIFAVLAILVAKLVADPIKQLAATSSELATGKLNTVWSAKSHVAEIKTLIVSTQELQDSLRESIGTVKDAADTLSTAVVDVDEKTGKNVDSVSQISDAINEVAETSQTVAQSAQNLAENAVSLGEDVDKLNENVDVLKTASDQIRNANEDASKYMTTVLNSSNESVSAVDEINAKISATNEAVSQISESVQIIDNIASETGLLSLNASIEAARAGEAGRGFAVVAENIKQLAESSSANAAKIKDIVNNVIALSDETVTVAEKVRSIIEAERGYINETQDKFAALSAAVDDSVVGINSIAATSAALEEIKNTLTSSTTDLGAISQELGASAEEVSAQCSTVSGTCTDTQARTEEMRAINDHLNDAVNFFSI